MYGWTLISVERFKNERFRDNLKRMKTSLMVVDESHEIKKIHTMVAFFEGDSCLSKSLADYFGEDIQYEQCGHCSYCRSGVVPIQTTTEVSEFLVSNLSKTLPNCKRFLFLPLFVSP